MTQDALSQSCLQLAELAREAVAWLEVPGNSDRVGAEKKSILRLLRRSARRASRLGRSAQSRMSVSVFGPSQAGKSFLVSVLARPKEGRLVADFAGNHLDYIQDLNPEGEGESTGLVTRFTTARAAVPAGFPIHLTLLSEADLVRVLANSFFMDGDRSEPAPEPHQITAHLDRFASRARPGAGQGMTYEEVIEIADYVQANFLRQSSYAAALQPFWETAALLAPDLGPEDRAEFLSILWGGHAPITALYQTLAGALARIGHAEDIYVGLEAVTPRETSILDVKTLGQVMQAEGERIEICSAAGLRVSLPRAQVCALAAELVLPMREAPHPLFATTDLLDFPGARNRFGTALAKEFAKPAQPPQRLLSELLLRGKVAYLFDRYVENQDITSMLLCVPDSNMDTVDLPRLVSTWIEQTHGPRPDQRALVDCILFFVLTKFDKHLGDSAAAGGDSSRFQRRIEASLLEKFRSGGDNWVENWTPGQAFRNCFWLRNPNFYVEGLIDYDPAHRERGIRPEKQARIAALRQGCLEAEAVQRHFRDPSRAWEAAMALNDGGVGYLVDELLRVCKPDQKLRQIAQQRARLVEDLLRALAPHHVADDLHSRIETRRAACDAIIDDLAEALSRHRFGALLQALMVDQDQIEEHIARVPANIRIGTAVTQAQAPGAAQAGLARPSLARPTLARPALARPDLARATLADPGRPGPQALAASQPESAVRSMTQGAFQAETALALWIDGIKRFRDDAALREAYGLGSQTASDLTAELIQAARRSGLAQSIAQDLGEIGFAMTVERQAAPAAILAAERINGFVATLGMQALPEARRPRVRAEGRPERAVFAARPLAEDLSDLPQLPRPIAQELWEDWVFALDTLVQDNAREGLGAEIDIAQNLALGRILAGIRAEGAP